MQRRFGATWPSSAKTVARFAHCATSRLWSANGWPGDPITSPPMLRRVVLAMVFAGFLAPFMFCPDKHVTRGEHVLFLERILDRL
jgi:hypothetical protein